MRTQLGVYRAAQTYCHWTESPRSDDGVLSTLCDFTDTYALLPTASARPIYAVTTMFYNMPHVELNMTARSYDAPINDNTSIFLWFRVSKHRLLGRSTLSFDGKSHRLTLLLIAGVEPNPGPAIRRTCGTCVRTIARNHRSVLCQDCNMHYHIKCNNISAAEYANIKGRMKYVTCINCKASKTQSDTYQDFNHAQSSDSHTNPMDLKLPRGLRICNMNIQGFRSSQDSFKLSMAPMTFDCIGICETNLPRKFFGW